MNRTAFFAIATICLPSLAHGESKYYVAGQVLEGTSLIAPGLPDAQAAGQPGAPEFPLPYTGVLTVSPESSTARFQFHFVFDPDGLAIDAFGHTANVYDGILADDDSMLKIDFSGAVEGPLLEHFLIQFDKQTQQGEWQWNRYEPSSASPNLPWPSASGTITSMSHMPEPTGAALTGLTLLFVGLRTRHRRLEQPRIN